MVIFHCISTLIFNAAHVAQGANSRELELNNPSQVSGAAKLRPLMAALIHALPKISTGKNSGKINNANIVPPRLKPTVNAAPMLPSKLTAGVPTTITNMIGKKVSVWRPSNKPNNGTNNVINNPELSQCTNIRSNTATKGICALMSICSKAPLSKSRRNIVSSDNRLVSNMSTQNMPLR